MMGEVRDGYLRAATADASEKASKTVLRTDCAEEKCY
jgi:hypothetical protein